MYISCKRAVLRVEDNNFKYNNLPINLEHITSFYPTMVTTKRTPNIQFYAIRFVNKLEVRDWYFTDEDERNQCLRTIHNTIDMKLC